MSTQQASPTASPTPIVSAPPSAAPQSWSAPAANAASAPQSWASSGTPQASTPTADQWQQAYSQLVAPQTPSSPSPVWAAPSTGIPQGYQPAPPISYPQAAPVYSEPAPAPQPAYPQTWQPQQTPVYPSAEQLQALVSQQVASQQAAASASQAPDDYLSRISEQSIEALKHFGPEAPAKLNAYAIEVEDALLEALGHQQRQAHLIGEQQAYIEKAQSVLQAAEAERNAMMHILSDPETLADYTTKFFGPGGVMPVQTPEEAERARLEQGLVGDNGRLMPTYNAGNFEPEQQQQAYARPQLPAMPQPNAPAPNTSPEAFWTSFSRQADMDITKAWQLLDQASPDQLRAKILVAE